jgi:twitching motility protein PilT
MTDATTLNDEQAVEALARERNVPFVRCGPEDVDVNAAQLLHRDEAQELEALPVAFGPDGKLLVAVADLDVPARLERVAALTNTRVYPALTTRAALHTAIAHFAADGPLGKPADADGARAPSAEPASAASTAAHGKEQLLAYERTAKLDLDAVLTRLVELGGSDLHLTVGLPPMLRVDGDLVPLDGQPVLDPDDTQQAVYSILRQKQREEFENKLELDTAYAIAGLARFRVNVFRQRESIGAVMRLIPQ